MKSHLKIDYWLFLPIAIGSAALFLPMIINPEVGGQIFAEVMDYIMVNFDWFFLWLTLGLFFLLLWLAFGPYGHVKLGKPEDKPEFSYFNWVAMLFCAGLGACVFYWPIVEPLFYLTAPPPGIETGTAQTVEWAHAYPIFHWGFIGWVYYTLSTVAIGYVYFKKDEKQLRPSVCCRSILGDRVDGWAGKVIDILSMLGFTCGCGTMLGLNVSFVSRGWSDIFGIPDTLMLGALVLASWIFIYGTSVYLGLEKGIGTLSQINVVSALAFAVYVFIVGPKTFMLSNFTNSFSVMLNNFFKMSLQTDPITKGGFPQAWTVFYWAWWASFGVPVGLFISRISKGRTLKQTILGPLIWGAAGIWVFHALLGGYTIYLEVNGIMPVLQILEESGPPGVIVAIIKSLPFGAIALPIFLVIAMIFSATTMDSAAYTFASLTTKRLLPHEQPARWNRLFWAIMLGLSSIAVFAVGGVEIAQATAIIGGLIVIVVQMLLAASLLVNLKRDYPTVKITAEEKHVSIPDETSAISN